MIVDLDVLCLSVEDRVLRKLDVGEVCRSVSLSVQTPPPVDPSIAY